MAETAVVGIDPGHKKCGLAAVGDRGVLHRAVVPPAELAGALRELAATIDVERIILGDGTRSAEVRAVIAAALPHAPITVVDETGTSLAARQRYWREHPPRGLWRLVPTTLRLPPVPIDDWAAVLLAERALRHEIIG